MIEPLILLPEMMCTARMWRPQIETFAQERSVTVIPTHLSATVGEVATQVIEAAPRKFALAGLGLGAIVAMEVIRRASGRVSRLALMATDALAETPQFAAQREEATIAAKAGRFSEAVATLPSHAALAPGLTRPEVQNVVQEMAAELGPEVFLRQTRLMQRRPDQQRTLRQVQAPILILGGAEDSAFPVKRQEFLAELAPSATLKIIENAGHLPTLEAPKATNALMRQWMQMPQVSD